MNKNYIHVIKNLKKKKIKERMPSRDLKKGERAYFLRSGGWPDLLMFTAVEREKPRKGVLEEVVRSSKP